MQNSFVLYIYIKQRAICMLGIQYKRVLSICLLRQMESDLSLEPGHLCNMGRLIEEMESKLRNGLDQVPQLLL